mmetsp:Transcript_73994/g.214106  ORF Transcript_73994/g.214106 Transcript_73994/m.214106 type:complete len:202 (+) Transcript_73994:927-1532(+)
MCTYRTLAVAAVHSSAVGLCARRSGAIVAEGGRPGSSLPLHVATRGGRCIACPSVGEGICEPNTLLRRAAVVRRVLAVGNRCGWSRHTSAFSSALGGTAGDDSNNYAAAFRSRVAPTAAVHSAADGSVLGSRLQTGRGGCICDSIGGLPNARHHAADTEPASSRRRCLPPCGCVVFVPTSSAIARREDPGRRRAAVGARGL